MGKIENGINGGFTGTVGAVTGYYLNGKWVIRSKRRKSIKNKGNNCFLKVIHEVIFHALTPLKSCSKFRLVASAMAWMGCWVSSAICLATRGTYEGLLVFPRYGMGAR